MNAESADYTVKFGSFARTLEYHDPQEHVRFTFDIAAPKTVVLEHHPRSMPRSDRYSIAFERTKEYLESCGYQVEVYGN